MELKKLPFDKGEFTASGVKYVIKNTLTLARFVEFEKLQNHFGFGLTFEGIVKKLNESIEYANKGKGVEAWNTIFNLKEGIAYRLEDRTHPVLLLASLFIVTEDEDLTGWNELDQKVKIDNWNREGYDINDFFQLASNLVAGFLPIYNEVSLSTSQKESVRKNFTGKKSSK
jgi:hypothetical protein